MSFLPVIRTGCESRPGKTYKLVGSTMSGRHDVTDSAWVNTKPGAADVCRPIYMDPNTEIMLALGGIAAVMGVVYLLVHKKKRPAAPASKVTP
jgi:hypothetical protein